MLLSADALAVLLGALALDAILGDPDLVWRRWPHPVVWFGWVISAADRALNREELSDAARRAGGTLFATLLTFGALLSGWAIEGALRALPGGPILVALAACVLIAARSLHDHVRRVATAFAMGGLPAARDAVSMIVGRDPTRLDEAGVARAAIESAAENFSDGVVAPAFWFALLGLPGIVAYKAVNTADSMIGHLSARHRAFGWAAARLDDLVNLLPARLSGCLIALAAPAGGGDVARAASVMWRDAGRHRSPNAGWPESAMAGALGIALAGPRIYASGTVEDPFLNPEGRTAEAADIRRALRIMLVAALLHFVVYATLAVLI